MANIIKTVIALRRATTAEWLEYKDVVPAAGEPCFDLDLHILKIGDGNTTYENLPVIGEKDDVVIAADGKSIIMTDGVFSLAGFDAAEIGAYPTKNADGAIEWVVPSTEAVDSLKSAVEVLQSDVKTLQEVMGTTTEGKTLVQMIEDAKYDDTALVARVDANEEALATLNGDATVEGSVLKTVQDEINAFATKISDDGIVNSYKELIDYVAEHGGDATKMASDIAALKGLVGETSVQAQIEAAGHLTKAEADKIYLSKKQAAATLEHIKYEIVDTPVGTLVDYGDDEIRVMVPANAQWTKQAVGATGNPNYYYMGFKAYAPEGAAGFKEGDRGVIVDEYFDFTGEFAGTDEFGRNYSVCWLALASYDEASGTWTYFGKTSSKSKYIGWTYVVEWYNADGIVIAADSIRINLSNESCHNTTEPYYIGALKTEVDTLIEEKISEVEIANEVIEF